MPSEHDRQVQPEGWPRGSRRGLLCTMDQKQVVLRLPVLEDSLSIPAGANESLADGEPGPHKPGVGSEQEGRREQHRKWSGKAVGNPKINQHVFGSGQGRIPGTGGGAAPAAILVPVDEHIDITGRLPGHVVVDLDIYVYAPHSGLAGAAKRCAVRVGAGEHVESSINGKGLGQKQPGIAVLEAFILIVGREAARRGAPASVAVYFEIKAWPEERAKVVVFDPAKRSSAPASGERSQNTQ